MDTQPSTWKESTWQIRPVLNMPELDPEAVQFALLESDPIKEYKTSLQQNRERFRREIEEEMDPSKKGMIRRIHMTVTWDRVFRTAHGDEVYLLVPSRSRKNQSLFRATVLSSSDSNGQRWLTTKITTIGDTPVCWCIPVQAAVGGSMLVELRKENVFDLQSLYREFVEQN